MRSAESGCNTMADAYGYLALIWAQLIWVHLRLTARFKHRHRSATCHADVAPCAAQKASGECVMHLCRPHPEGGLGFTVIYHYKNRGQRPLLRAAEAINYPKIAQDICPDSRRGKGRIAVLCNPCRNAEAGQRDKQDGIIYCFRGPYLKWIHGFCRYTGNGPESSSDGRSY